MKIQDTLHYWSIGTTFSLCGIETLTNFLLQIVQYTQINNSDANECFLQWFLFKLIDGLALMRNWHHTVVFESERWQIPPTTKTVTVLHALGSQPAQPTSEADVSEPVRRVANANVYDGVKLRTNPSSYFHCFEILYY